MDEKKPQGQPSAPVTPGVAEQLEQMKKSVPGTSQRLFDFLTENTRTIIVTCVVIVLAVGVWEGVKYWRAKEAAKASDQLGLILIQKTELKSRIEALEGFVKTAPGSLKSTALLELAAADMLDKQYDKAASAWAELESSSSPDLKAIAGIGHAKSLILAGKPQEALTLLKALKDKAPKSYAEAVTRQIAVAAEAAGDSQAASAAYAELAGKAEGAGKPYFEFKANQLKPKS